MKTTPRTKKPARQRPVRRKPAVHPLRRVTTTHAAGPERIDFSRLFKDEYMATASPSVVEAHPARYLAITGEGAPGGLIFQARIGALYAMAFTVKMSRKSAGAQDYVISPLEVRYLNLATEPMPPKDEWRWQLLVRTPEFVTVDELARAANVLHERGQGADANLVTLATLAEGRCVQMLHVGPYDEPAKTIAALRRYAAAHQLRVTGAHHEIYLNDPRRTAPAKLRTIIRLPVAA